MRKIINPEELNIKNMFIKQIIAYCDDKLSAGDVLEINPFVSNNMFIRIYKDADFKIDSDGTKEYNMVMIELYFCFNNKNKLVASTNDVNINEYEFEHILNELYNVARYNRARR